MSDLEFDRIQCILANRLSDMADFLKDTSEQIEQSPAMPPERLNLRLLLQVHLSAVLEANTAYECAIRESLVNQHLQNHQPDNARSGEQQPQ